jgi:DNA-binding IclR family transcriptional regulator
MSEEVPSTGTVDRVALLLKVLAEGEGEASVAQIVEKMNLPTSTTHRLLGLLVKTGLAARGVRAGTYCVGLEFLRLGGLVVSRTEVSSVAETFMQLVATTTGETCILNLYNPAEHKAMITKVIYGHHPLRIEQELYKASPLVYGALGRSILAFLPEVVVGEVLARHDSSPVSGRPLSDIRGVRRDLADIRERSYALSKGQRTPGAVGLGSPIFGAAGSVIGSLCITMPETRFAASRERKLAQVLIEQASRLSASLGYDPSPMGTHSTKSGKRNG